SQRTCASHAARYKIDVVVGATRRRRTNWTRIALVAFVALRPKSERFRLHRDGHGACGVSDRLIKYERRALHYAGSIAVRVDEPNVIGVLAWCEVLRIVRGEE